MVLFTVSEHQLDHWVNQISKYQRLLQAHSVSINLTKLASLRLDLLTKDSESEKHNGPHVVRDQSSLPSSPLVSAASRADIPIASSVYHHLNDFGIQWYPNIVQ